MESIGERAFEDCSGLIDVISEIQSPFEIAENVFEGVYTKAKLTVPVGTIEKYQATNYWNLFANIVEKDLPPVDDGETVDFGDDIDEDTNLDGNVVGNIYFNISSDDGGYNSAEGCIVVNKPTDDSSVDGQDIFGEDFHDNFTGIVFKVPAGSGTVKVEAQTTGSMVLKVKIGNNEPVSMELDGKLKASFPYNVTEPTFVYIYAGSNGSSAPGLFGNSANNGELKIYGIEVDNYIKGDVNGDGVVDVSDYIGVANHILGNTPVGFDTYAADVNNDGVIDVSDYIGIANIILTGSIYGNSNNAAPAFEEDAELDPQ